MIAYLDNAATTRVLAGSGTGGGGGHDRALLQPLVPLCPAASGAAKALECRPCRRGQGVWAAVPEELTFTSCGTESDNWAIRAAAELDKRKGKHIVTTAIEHRGGAGALPRTWSGRGMR